MPAGNRTGPRGTGPRTGRDLGYCAGCGTPGFVQAGRGSGWGRGPGGGAGRGFGRGPCFRGYGPPIHPGPGPGPFAPWPVPAPTREGEWALLKELVEYFQGALEDLRARMADLEGSPGKR